MTENIGSERFLDTDDTAQAPPRRRANGVAPASESKPNMDILATLKAAREAAEHELQQCEERVEALRNELGLSTVAAPRVFATVVEHTNDDADDEVVKPKRAARATKAPKVKKAAGRLARRSAEQISADVDRIVAIVKKSKAGLRSEEIRAKLDLLPKEMPRLLKQGIKDKALKSKGEKRATVYSAA